MMKLVVTTIMALMMVESSYSFTMVQSQQSRYKFQQRYMFSTDETSSSESKVQIPAASPLEVVSDSTTVTSTTTDEPVIRTSTPVERPKMMAKNMNTGEVKEVKWVDPAMRAHTNPLQMDWWAYPIIGLPFILLLNDALHFIPEDGPLSYILRF